jgi:hypothetical protein
MKNIINKIRLFLIAIILLVQFSASIAQVHVNGYYRKNGTYVQPHYRSSPNLTKMDNWSTKGNVNPYTGRVGTKNVYENPNQNYNAPITNEIYSGNYNNNLRHITNVSLLDYTPKPIYNNDRSIWGYSIIYYSDDYTISFWIYNDSNKYIGRQTKDLRNNVWYTYDIEDNVVN